MTYAAMNTRVRNALTLRPTTRGKIVGDDPKVHAVLATIDRVARSTCTVLVCGESGTGKELVVAALHDASLRRDGPLVTINCGAIPVELVEAELFGHARGAFTGAQLARKGHVAAAEGGTLFLDEVGELPMSAQVKLLRLLQRREYTPLGESRSVQADVRIVAATNRDLAAGRFREDLFWRLNVIQIALPPLRERGRDVTMLATHFFRAFTERCGRPDLVGFSPAALEAIQAHGWPGNVRALENAVERAVLLANGPSIEVHDIFPHAVQRTVGASLFPRMLPESGVDLVSVVESYGNHLIRQALVRTGGNKNRAAQLLGVNRTTLVEMIRRRGIAAR